MTKEKRLKKIANYLNSSQNLESIVASIVENRLFYEGIGDISREAVLASLQNMFVSECVKANQYVRIGSFQRSQISVVYEQLIDGIRALFPGRFDPSTIRGQVIAHRNRLILVLEGLADIESSAEIVPCSEYSIDFQKEILRIDQKQLIEPILDVGCGRKFSLVSWLLQEGCSRVFGLDQYVSDKLFIFSGNWMEWGFGVEKWGTIISHMAFSNHCRNALFRNRTDSMHRLKYHEMLLSLKIGGTFVYTPRILEFEEEFDENQFSVRTYRNSSDRDLDTVMVKRAF